MANRRTVAAGLTVAAVALAAVWTAQLVVPANAESALTLAEAGRSAGIDVGVAVSNRTLVSGGVDEQIAQREFSSVTPEVELLFDVTEQQRNEFSFGRADSLVAWAAANGKSMRSGDLLRGATFMNWLANLPSSTIQEAVLHHIDVVMSRYKGKISSWDVVSEAFYDNGSRRNDILARTGSDWIDKAFTTARAADPTGKLCYSDYNLENWTWAKTQAVYSMVKDLKSRGVPIDCVGLEGHFLTSTPYPSSFLQTLTAFAALGVDVQITQLDVTGNSAQAWTYGQVARDCRSVERCTAITVWGIRDHESWRSSEEPVLFDKDGRPKPAYYSFRDGLSGVTPTTTTPTTTTPTTTSPTTTSPTTTSPTTTSTKPTSATKTKPPKTKRTVTACKTRKQSIVTCKLVTKK